MSIQYLLIRNAILFDGFLRAFTIFAIPAGARLGTPWKTFLHRIRLVSMLLGSDVFPDLVGIKKSGWAMTLTIHQC